MDQIANVLLKFLVCSSYFLLKIKIVFGGVHANFILGLISQSMDFVCLLGGDVRFFWWGFEDWVGD